MHLKLLKKAISIKEQEKVKNVWHVDLSEENVVGLQNLAYGISDLLNSALQHGTINLLLPDISFTAFINQKLKHAKIFIILIRNFL